VADADRKHEMTQQASPEWREAGRRLGTRGADAPGPGTGPGVVRREAVTARRGWDPRSWMLAVRAETPVQWS